MDEPSSVPNGTPDKKNNNNKNKKESKRENDDDGSRTDQELEDLKKEVKDLAEDLGIKDPFDGSKDEDANTTSD